MLSILIPVYNFNIVELVNMVHIQASNSGITFEIVCIDDNSENFYTESNQLVLKLHGVTYLKNNENLGRNKTRQILSNNANYNWLLFLDADVIPKNHSYIKSYLPFLNIEFEAIYGGFAYYKKSPEKAFKLRWKYGRKCEEVPANKRNLKPYKSIISANFLIKKTVFNRVNSKIKGNLYGEDNHFGALLKSHNIRVKHIDNEVYHLGIEESEKYLKKKEQAAITLLNLYNSVNNLEHDNDLLVLFEKSKRLKVNYIFSFLFKLLKKPIIKNLLGNNPSINLLQFYRIGFMCHEDLKIN